TTTTTTTLRRGRACASSRSLSTTAPRPSAPSTPTATSLPHDNGCTPAQSTQPSRERRERIIFSGIQPTGIPHLGNYLGALKEWVRLQDEHVPATTAASTTDQAAPNRPSAKLLFSVVDLHALTVPKEAKLLRQWRREALAVLLAIGLDPSRSTLFLQSDVPADCELMWLLSTVASVGYLSRMTQWKSKINVSEIANLDDQAVRARLRLGLFSYPVLQAADILVHRATDVPVGEDQKQHIEFTRDTANSFNYLYGDVLTMPEALISPSKRVMSLKDPAAKMSKSHPDEKSRILLTDDAATIHRKFRQALTDSHPGPITYDRAHRPGVANLLEILAHVEETGRSSAPSAPSSPAELASQFQNSSLRVLKEHVAQRVAEHLAPIRERYAALLGERSSAAHLDEVAQNGARAAQLNAEQTLRAVKRAMGLAEYSVLLLGLDNAGKTTLLNQVKALYGAAASPAAGGPGRPNPDAGNTVPTIGQNVATVALPDMYIKIWDVGGQMTMRRIWQSYYASCHAIVFVVDSSDLGEG
ncbi:Tryptophan--tRNA ligase, mitochondrial, partial [Ascosphaera acerosa]